jgi:pyrroloquinoline quinone (PQQ) biosynthesis protein C
MNTYSLPYSEEAIIDFRSAVMALLNQHRPSRMPFFRRLASLPFQIASDPEFLGEIYLVYQAAMHATRAAVFRLPHLDSPGLRKRKLQILIDTDGLANGDTRHYQLTRAFRNIGAHIRVADEEFGNQENLCHYLDQEAAHFVRLAQRLYARSLGPWCAIEVLSVDCVQALVGALSVHFPQFIHEPYFEGCFSQHIEERHADEALAMTQQILRHRPELLPETMRDAKLMAEALDGVWHNLDRITQRACRRTDSSERGRWSLIANRVAEVIRA